MRLVRVSYDSSVGEMPILRLISAGEAADSEDQRIKSSGIAGGARGCLTPW